jgi:hypothetical protein
MFGIIKKRKPVILAHWYVPLLDFQSNAAEFYESVKADLKKREVPEMIIERIDFKEGGWFSSNHEYLRLRRERVVFDICSARFGTGWWFSLRAAVLPRVLFVWEIILALLGLGSFFVSYVQMFGLPVGSIVFGGSFLFLFVVFFAAKERAELDEFLLYMPVIGAIYERFFRAETYFRQDKRLTFADIVNAIVRAKAKEFCVAGGVSEPTFREVKNPSQILSERELVKYLGVEAPPV